MQITLSKQSERPHANIFHDLKKFKYRRHSEKINFKKSLHIAYTSARKIPLPFSQLLRRSYERVWNTCNIACTKRRDTENPANVTTTHTLLDNYQLPMRAKFGTNVNEQARADYDNTLSVDDTEAALIDTLLRNRIKTVRCSCLVAKTRIFENVVERLRDSVFQAKRILHRIRSVGFRGYNSR